MTSSKPRGWILELSVGGACALAIFLGLEFSATAPGQRRAVETLEAQVGAQSGGGLPPSSTVDRSVARRLCTGSLARAIGDLEGAGPRRAREAGLANLQVRVNSPTSQGGMFFAPVEMTFSGPTPRLGVQLAHLSQIAPSVFLDKVALTPSGTGRNDAVVEIKGRLVCARP